MPELSEGLPAVLLGLASASCFASASVLQHRATHRPSEEPLRIGFLLARVARNPMWLLGAVFDLGGVGLQGLALHFGTLVVVQCVLVLGVVLVVPIAAWIEKRPMVLRELADMSICALGVGLFVGFANPSAGNDHVSPVVVTECGVALGVGLALSYGLTKTQRAAARAVTLAAVTGMVYGFTSVLLKISVDLLSGGVLHLITHWQPFALLAIGLLGANINQIAFQTGQLPVVIATISITEPVVSILLGITALHERLASGTAIAFETGGVALAAYGIARVSTSNPAARSLESV